MDSRSGRKLIDEGDTVLLDDGSTTYELARALVGRSLPVVTNSLPVAMMKAADEVIVVADSKPGVMRAWL